MTDCFHLAQLNVATILAPLDHPRMAEFVGALDRINALAEASPGFVWRLRDDSGNATALRPFGPEMLVNMSVWESAETLADYVYRSQHARYLARRKEWFAMPSAAYLALWWIPSGSRPTLEKAKRRLDLLQARGPSPEAFTLTRRFQPPVEAPALAEAP